MVKTGRKTPRKNIMARVLEQLQREYIFATPDDIETLYIYRDGVYVPGETTIKAEVEKIRGDNTDTSFCNEVINHFKRRSYVPRTTFNQFEGEIPVLNGLLNLETMQLRDFDPEKIFTYKIDTRFDPDKDCPRFKAGINKILPEEDEQALLQEYAGYTLWPEFPHHKLMILIGTGRNGKGVIVRTIVGILGQDNVSNIRLEYLDGSHRFMVPNLFGKLMNVCSEPATRRAFKTELLKQITGQDTLDGEIKGKQNPLRFIPFAKFYIQANKLPMVDDTTLSFWDRIIIIEFTETFTDEKGNKTAEIENIWLNDEGERSGILNWMIEGLRRLKENGRFTQTKSMSQQILKFKQASDPMGAFFADPQECMFGAIQWVTRNDLYEAYKEYAEDIGTRIESPEVFAARIKKLPGVKGRKKRVKGMNERIWTGISTRKKDTALEDYEKEAPEEEAPEQKNGATGAGGTCIPPCKNENNKIYRGETHNPAPLAPAAPLYTPLEKEGVERVNVEESEPAQDALRDKPRASNVQDLYEKAEKALGEAGGWMWAGEFWDALERLGHPRRLAEYPLNDPGSPVEFVGFKVRLKEAKP